VKIRVEDFEEGGGYEYEVHIPSIQLQHICTWYNTIPSRVNVWGRWRRESERSLKRKETSIFQS
jgi:hypothetical protein